MVQFKYADSRLAALRMYLGDENTTVEQELISCLDRLWEQKIPEAVREYIERSEKQERTEKPKDSRRTSGQKKPVSGAAESAGADARSDGEKAT